MRWITLLIILTLSFISGLLVVNSNRDFNKRNFYLASLLYITFLGMILFTPISFDGTSVYIMQAGTGAVNLHHIYSDLGFMENIILTIPLGFLIKNAFSKVSLISMASLGIVIGGSIETMQYFLSHLFLINRTSDISDVVSNAIGVLIGAILLIIYQVVFEKKSVRKLLNN
ncbi:MAG TPA: hypothetical protein DEQ50_09930 [Lactobacillus sp.]|nr:hypothetical protein [Lactobacillus sp.]